MKRIQSLLILAVVGGAVLLPAGGVANNCTWNGSVSSNWTDSGNWDIGVPGSGDTAILNSTSSGRMPILAIPSGTTNIAGVELGASTTGMTLTMQGLGTLACSATFHIGAKGTLTHDYNGNASGVAGFTTNVPLHKINLACASFTLDAGGLVDVSGRGFQGTNGPGSSVNAGGAYSTGGSYGGLGGNSYGVDASDRYGSWSQPTDLGSGGGGSDGNSYQSAGGGAVVLNASSTATINGRVNACGTNASTATYKSGGSGGSIWVQAATMTGSGTLNADGGSCSTTGNGGGGGGGRIALAYTSGSPTFTVTAMAGAGRTTERGSEMGTFLAPPSFFSGDMVVTQQTYALAPGNYNLNSLTITNGGAFEIVGSNGVMPTLTIANGLTITSNGYLYVRGDTNTPYGSGCAIQAATINVKTGGFLTASGKGFRRTTPGPGAGWNGYATKPYWSGGSHGGDGGAASDHDVPCFPHGKTYGSATNPVSLGSALSNQFADAGGAIKVVATSSLTVNGTLAADGLPSLGSGEYYGGGAGGSLWIVTPTLSGAGTISAKGSSSPGTGGSYYPSGGGGGRIAIYGNVSGFTGAINLSGGTNGQANFGQAKARAGTLYMSIFTNGSAPSWTVTSDTALAPGSNYTFSALLVTNTAALELQGDWTAVGGGTGGTNFGVGVWIHATSIDVAPGSTISAYTLGFPAGMGPGTGGVYSSDSRYSGGSSHGGLGGNKFKPAGPTYGSSNYPTALGSGAGNLATVNAEGPGGGAIHLTANSINVNGTINAGTCSFAANGHNGAAGGSILLETGVITGTNTISANGGNANDGNSNGGGGGRIAIYYLHPTAAFPGGTITLSASGGTNGAAVGNYGSNGTIYVAQLAPNIANLAATNILTTSAWLNGNLIATNGSPTSVWVYWGTNDGGQVKSAWSNSYGFGVEPVISGLTYQATSLPMNTTIFYTYYASNLYGDTWAPTTSFQTQGNAAPTVDNDGGAVNISAGSAWLRGTLGVSVANVTVYWGPSDGSNNPTAWAANAALPGTAIGVFSNTASALLYGIPYYYRCYATNAGGGVWASASTNLTTLRPTGGSTPSLTNNAPATSVTPTSATVNAALYCPGAVYNVWVSWWVFGGATNTAYVGSYTNQTSANPTYAITGLSSNTTYNFTFSGMNAVETNSAPNVLSFTTAGTPSVNNGNGASNIGSQSALLNGALTSGYQARVYFQYGTSAGNLNNSLDAGTVGQTAFSAVATNLTGGMTWYYRCYATNSYGTAYSTVTNFTTRLAGNCTWNGSVSSDWNDYGNWDAGVPAAGDTAILNSAPYGRMPLLAIPAGTTNAIAGVELGSSTTNMSLTMQGLGTLACSATFHIGAKGTLAHDYNGGYTTNVPLHKINLASATFTLDAGGLVDVSGRGFQTTNGPGHGVNSGAYSTGGSYGGLGGNSWAVDALDRYGSWSQPTDLGSGGGDNSSSLSAGGGAVAINASGTATINGRVNASGTNATSGYLSGGSGGSIWIQAASMNGTGTLNADGGSTNSGGSSANYWGGGGGGRIAITYASGTPAFTVTAKSGLGRTLERGAEQGTFSAPASFFSGDMIVTQQTYALAPGNYTLNSLTINNGGALEIVGNNGAMSTLTMAGALTIATNGYLYVRGDTNTQYGSGCAIQAGTVDIQTGGFLTASGKGFRKGGPGAGWNGYAGYPYWTGGSHGGDGGAGSDHDIAAFPHGKTYGSATNPVALGSAVPNAHSDAGGAIKVVATSSLNVNGALTADGLNGSLGNGVYNGGGSGGSLWIVTPILSGSGTISAQGSAINPGNYPAGGGGGRIAIYAGTRSGFTGAIKVNGGTSGQTFLGQSKARAGTLYMPEFADGSAPTWTVTSDTALAPVGMYTFSSLLVTNGAALELQGNTNAVGDGTGGTNFGVGVWITATKIDVAAGSSISAYALGFPGGFGPGTGAVEQADTRYAGGSSYGGLGGSGFAAVGPTYGSSNRPTALGSGAGGIVGANAESPGGGAMRLTAKTINVNGIIDAGTCSTAENGFNGGSGGSIWLEARSITGTNTIMAKGGSAIVSNGNANGGGGGRIAIYYMYPTATFPSGGFTVAVNGGVGSGGGQNGNLGTYYLQQQAAPGTAIFVR